MDKDIFAYWKAHNSAPYPFPTDLGTWKDSWENDTDADGRTLFTDLHTDLMRDSAGAITGLIHYGRTAFGFDEAGEISRDVHHNVIRELCFDDPKAGEQLLRSALSRFPAGERVHAFFHYFGMSACARHGKLPETAAQVHGLLLSQGLEMEHENVYYSRTLTRQDLTAASLGIQWKEPSPGHCREFSAADDTGEVCWGQVHFLPQGDIAYLRWIYVEEARQHRGVGSRVMEALFAELWARGIRRFDTDTARDNTAAQRFYEKMGFQNRGITRSYYTK